MQFLDTFVGSIVNGFPSILAIDREVLKMAKKYNHRRAEEEFKKMKKKDEKFMRENGMP